MFSLLLMRPPPLNCGSSYTPSSAGTSSENAVKRSVPINSEKDDNAALPKKKKNKKKEKRKERESKKPKIETLAHFREKV